MQDYLAQAEQHAGWGFGHFDQLIEEARASAPTCGSGSGLQDRIIL
jgi:hypothetical protein